MTLWTLHTDESGTFEGPSPASRRVIVALLAPALSHEAIADLRSRARAVASARRFSLHASESKASCAVRDENARGLITLWRDVLAQDAPGASPCVVAIAHERDAAGVAFRDPLAGPAFAANRYHRMRLELLRQILAFGPWLERGDEIDLNVASRVFPVRQEDLPMLEAMGYRRLEEPGPLRVHMSNADGLRGALQALFLDGNTSPLAAVRRLNVMSIGRSDDPRFWIVDTVANYLFRHQRDLESTDVARAVGLTSLPVHILWLGRPLAALTAASEALSDGDLSGALEALGGVRQPAGHAALERRLLERLLLAAQDRLEPTVAEALLRRAELVLDHRRYDLLDLAQRAARLVERSGDIDPPRAARAATVLGTVANHRGDVELALAEFGNASRDKAPATLDAYFRLVDSENRSAVARLNGFAFDEAAAVVTPYLAVLEDIVARALRNDARDRMIGELAGTLAQAAAHAGRWDDADRAFATARRHLGEDHMQAAFRAHAAIERNDEARALEEAECALGSTYGVEGYDRALGAEALNNPRGTFERVLADRPFDAWLVAKLAARGWLGDPNALAPALAGALSKRDETRHPFILIHLAVGRLAIRANLPQLALTTLEAAWRRFQESAPTLAMLRVQVAAELALLEAPNATLWFTRTTEALAVGLMRLPSARRWFAGSESALAQASTAAPRQAALHRLLGRFTFLYR